MKVHKNVEKTKKKLQRHRQEIKKHKNVRISEEKSHDSYKTLLFGEEGLCKSLVSKIPADFITKPILFLKSKMYLDKPSWAI